jgi:hypothetical protein
MEMKRGIVFTTDVGVGLGIAIVIILVFISLEFESNVSERKYERLNYVTEDITNLLSYLQVKDVEDRPTIKRLIENGVIKEYDLNETLFDLIGGFWFSGNKTIAENISREVLENLTKNVCVNITTDSETIYSSCNTSSEEIAVRSKVASGYQTGKPVYGYMARAFLTSIKAKTTSAYVYFGGYTGNGNLTEIMNLPSFDRIIETTMELDTGSNFSLYINGNFSGSYIKGSAGGGELRADKWTVCNNSINPSYCSFLKSGNNTIEFIFNNITDNYIAGGYVKVVYNTSQMASEPEENVSWFPGIKGFINLYSSFYIPGDLNSMAIHLHYKNNYTTYLTIGNTEVFRNNKTNEQVIDIPNSNLTSLLNYQNLSRKTVPIRLGTDAFAIETIGRADIILITDVSGSMNDRLDSGSTGFTRNCNDPNLNRSDTKRISLAQCLDKNFVNIVLNTSGNRIGLVAYSGKPNQQPEANSVVIRSYHDLSTDNTSLYSQINSYTADGATGICDSIRQARIILEQQSNASRQKYIIVMTDGIANVQCDPTNENNTVGCLPCEDYVYCRPPCGEPQRCTSNPSFPPSCSGGGSLQYNSQCGDYVSYRAVNDSINDSCKARNRSNITVYSIGFGPVQNCQIANTTLQGIANCGNGSYYSSSNATQLQEIYKRIAGEIVNVSFVAQKVVISGKEAMNNTLYPDSYIWFNYTPIVIPYKYGEISLTRETDRFRTFTGDDIDIPDKEGWFNVSDKVTVVDSKATSYSSEYWTDRLYVKNSSSGWKRVYWLDDYGSDYRSLGDPFIVQIPVNYIGTGNNSVRIGTGSSPTNATGGSPDDRVIYTIRLKGSVGYGSIFNSSYIAINDSRQRLIQQISDYVSVGIDDITVDEKSISGIRWLWGPSMFKVLVWEK